MSRIEASNSTGKEDPQAPRPKEGPQRHKAKLETVVERSNEISREYTDRIGPGTEARKTRRSSPFVVEKFDLELDLDDEAEEEQTRGAGGRGLCGVQTPRTEKERQACGSTRLIAGKNKATSQGRFVG